MISEKEQKREARHRRIRKKIQGNGEVPRLCIHRSNTNLQAHIVDDVKRKVLFGASTTDKEFKSKVKNAGNIKAASLFGEEFAKLAGEKGIKKVCFDRCGYLYHGRIKAFAEAARKGGMKL